ncbi:hypothetical protein CDV36_009891 [Fusarium kuroshium]|uniref:Uncharacterized protein n=1 Tax=Fusarium kuroshium TaxID=2010991 RepID=A0A3M2RYU8_9HYPO|nr:hypothetical protein CDV36_009891 [Fusarium kuroshium]
MQFFYCSSKLEYLFFQSLLLATLFYLVPHSSFVIPNLVPALPPPRNRLYTFCLLHIKPRVFVTNVNNSRPLALKPPVVMFKSEDATKLPPLSHPLTNTST